LGPNKGQNKDIFDKTSKIFFSCTTGWNALIFGMEHPWDKEIQLYSNELPGVINGHALRGHSFICQKYFKVFSDMNHWPKIASIVVLDSQALLTIRTYIVKKHYSL